MTRARALKRGVSFQYPHPGHEGRYSGFDGNTTLRTFSGVPDSVEHHVAKGFVRLFVGSHHPRLAAGTERNTHAVLLKERVKVLATFSHVIHTYLVAYVFK